MSNQKKTVVITGGTGGIGYFSSIGIAKLGHRIILIGRNQERGKEAVQQIIKESNNSNISFVCGDVSSISSINRLVSKISTEVECIDVLINNAGYFGSEFKKNDDGLELHFAINVLAPYLLTKLLLPNLKQSQSPRVLNITGGDKPDRIDIDNLQAEKGFKGLMTYTHSKSIMESMSIFLSKELQSDDISVNIIFPGRASTTMTRSLSSKSLPGLMKLMLPFFKLYFTDDGGKSASLAAKSTIWAATSSELDGITGRYFDTNMKEQALHPTAYDENVQSKILHIITSITLHS